MVDFNNAVCFLFMTHSTHRTAVAVLCLISCNGLIIAASVFLFVGAYVAHMLSHGAYEVVFVPVVV